MNLDSLYAASPVWVQTLMATGYGVKELLLRHGGSYPRFVREIEEANSFTAAKLQEIQNERLQNMARFSYEQVPYYRQLFDSLGLRPSDIRSAGDLKKLPVLEKETVRDNLEKFIPRNCPERLIPQTTGGTTGTPLHYYVTPSAVQYNYAAYEVRFRRWAGVHFGQKFASINGKVVVPLDQKKPPFWRYNMAFKQVYLSAYHMSEENLVDYVRCLQDYAPEFIVGYVSTIHELAKFILNQPAMQGRVRPKAVLLSSETLFEWMREDIEAAFGCRVFNGYGLGEMTALITECESGSMHISPEYGVVEQVEIGGNNEIITTGLFNYGTPLLRYRTGDTAEPGDEKTCACGRELPRIGAILGRIDDRVVTPEGAVVGPATLSLAFQSVPHLREAQIVQEVPGEILLKICAGKDFTPEDRDYMMTELRKRLGARLKIHLSAVDEISRTAAGKKRLIVSRLKKCGF